MKPFKTSFIGWKHAFDGLESVFLSERNFRIHLLIAFLTILLGFYLNLSSTEWIWIIVCIGAVLTAEVFNSAIEGLVDMVQPNQHPVAGKIKDISAAAVFLSALAAVVIGALIFFPKILAIL